MLVTGFFNLYGVATPQSSSLSIPNFHAAAAVLSGNLTNAASGEAVYDEQLGITFTQSFSSVAYNVTAVLQQDSDNYGPAYLLNGLTDSGYWYQIGVSYNWPNMDGTYITGFNVNYNVFDSTGNTVLPSNGGGGVESTTGGSINQGDNVGLSLSFSGSDVLMSVNDWTSGATAEVTYSSEGATEFVGLSVPSNSNGFFTGLMTEEYHNNAYTGGESSVQYSNTAVPLSSALFWIDEFNVYTQKLEFGSASGVVSFSQSPSQFHSFSLQGATESANANDFITGSATSGSANTVQFTLSYSVVGGGTALAPTFSYTSNGVQQTATLSTSPSVYTLDVGTSWSITNPLSGSTSTQRWVTNQTTSGTVSSAQTINFAYGHQYYVTFNTSPSSEGSTSPSGSNWYNAGQTYSISATAVSSYFLTSWTATSSLTIANPSSSSTTVLIGGSGTVTANFGVISLSLNSAASTITQGASIRITGTATGTGSADMSVSGGPSGATFTLSSNTLTLTTSGTQFTLTIGTAYTTATGIFTITIASTVSGVGNTSAQYTLAIREAVPLTVGYSVEGSGSGYSAPTITYTYNGTSSQASLTSMFGVIYVDQNSQWSVSSLLSGSTSTERWATNQSNTGEATSATTINFVYYHQYLVQFGYSVVGGGSGYTAPAVTAVQFGSKFSPTISQQNWVDAGSQYSYTNQLSGSTQSERWQAINSSSPIGQISSSTTISPQYYYQFSISAQFSVSNAGSPATGPTFTFVMFGLSQSSTLTMTPESYWADAESNYNASGLITGSQERWITNTTTSGTVTSGLSLNFQYDHQYYFTTQTQAGGTVNPTSEWVNDGDSISISNTAIQGWKFEFWTGTGSGSYSGNANTTMILIQGPVTENATFYVGLTIVTTSGGSVSYTYGNSGSVQVTTQASVYVPVGTVVTLNANPTLFLYRLNSWSGAATGASTQTSVTVNSPSTAEAHFGYNVVDIAGASAAIVIVIAAIAVILSRRKPA